MNALQSVELQELDQATFDNEEQRAELQERFRVTDLNSANWCLRKMQALTAKIHETNQLSDAEVLRINQWREHEVSGIERQMQFFEMLLTDYHAQMLRQDLKAKTITTPYGKLKSTTRKAQPKKVDDEQLLQHIKSSGDTEYIITKESPAWGEYKKTLQVTEINGVSVVMDQNGQRVQGVEVELGGTSFKVEVSE